MAVIAVLEYLDPAIYSSGGYRGVAMVSAETPSENRAAPNLLTSCLVSDKIATYVIEGLSTGEKLHSLAFEISTAGCDLFFFFFFFGL